MNDENEPSGADGGSRPVAYEIHWKGQDGQYLANPYLVFANEQPSEHWRPSPRCVPLYRHPQPSLTDEEREAVSYFSEWCIGPSERLKRYGDTLRSLLERTGNYSDIPTSS